MPRPALAVNPRMWEAVDYVRSHPGASQFEVNTAISPHGPNGWGWEIIVRCIQQGLIERRPGARSGWYALYVAEQNEGVHSGQ